MKYEILKAARPDGTFKYCLTRRSYFYPKQYYDFTDREWYRQSNADCYKDDLILVKNLRNAFAIKPEVIV